MTILFQVDEDLLYPSSDGKPMAESTLQYQWIVLIKENLEAIFSLMPMVFIAADLLWYPVQKKSAPVPRIAPDVMVAFGRPKGTRRSYKQWEEDDIPPQVVFEILSASNKTRDGEEAMAQKFVFYEHYGVEEYYIYDPDDNVLEGWLRQDNELVTIPVMSNWVSPRLGIRFAWQLGRDLVLYRPDGTRFISLTESEQRAEQAESQLQAERQKRQQLLTQLRNLSPEQLTALGIDADALVDS
jgi:Uma2 family endonuclease